MRDHPVIKKRSRFCPLADGGGAVRIEGKVGQKAHPYCTRILSIAIAVAWDEGTVPGFAPPRQRIPQP